MIKLIYITGATDIAEFVLANGANLVMVDLEKLGKRERQAGRNTWLSNHVVSDVAKIISRVGSECVIVRTDPIHEDTPGQLEEILRAGAKCLMLPMYTAESEVDEFLRIVDGRASVIPLVETTGAVACFDAVTRRRDIDRVHVGLNDLQISAGTNFLFEPIVNGQLEDLARIAEANRTAFGFGGIARIGEGLIPAESILVEHMKLNSSAVILSRTFRKGDGRDDEAARTKSFQLAVNELRDREEFLKSLTSRQLELESSETAELIRQEVQRRRAADLVSNEASI